MIVRDRGDQRVEEAAKLASQIVSNIFWELNLACALQNVCAGDQANITDRDRHDQTIVLYRAFELCARYCAGAPKEARYQQACADFIKEVGWDVFAILTFSEEFYKLERSKYPIHWNAVTSLLITNRRSIKIFASSRGLEWRAPLLPLFHQNPEILGNVLSPEIDISQEHPHHIVQTSDGLLRRPTHRGEAQVTIGSNLYDPNDFEGKPPYPFAPPADRTLWNRCMMCAQEALCDCRVDSLAGELIELVEYPGRGVGVRTLCQFSNGDILGQYVGDVIPYPRPNHFGKKHKYRDETYQMLQLEPVAEKVLAKRTAERLELRRQLGHIIGWHHGNWTRFMNHSCDSNNDFLLRALGKEAVVIVVAVKNIDIFEEITVSYGWDYWRHKPQDCRCGAATCISLNYR